MTTLKHPTIPDVTVEVDARSVEEWKAAGWLDPRALDPRAKAPKTPAGDDG